jgi:hypothetical protein
MRLERVPHVQQRVLAKPPVEAVFPLGIELTAA